MTARALVTATALLVAALAGCHDDGPARGLRRAAREVAAGIHGAVLASEHERAPFRCARPEDDGATAQAAVELGSVGGRAITETGDVIQIGDENAGPEPATASQAKRPRAAAPGASVVLGVVADARSASPATLAALGRLEAEMAEAGVDVVLVLGGMSRRREDLAKILALLVDGERWPVIVMPGDREEVPALRAAIRDVGASEAALIDGSQARLVLVSGAAIALFPGMGYPERLVAGDEGCIHLPSDADALAHRLGDFDDRVRVWASYAAPRLTGNAASDVAIGGVHVGETPQTVAIASAGAHIVVHAGLDEAGFGPVSGQARLSPEVPLVLGAGSADPLPITNERGQTARSSAMVVSIDGTRARYRRIAGQ